MGIWDNIIGNVAGAAVNAAGTAISNKQNFNLNKKLMYLQNDLNIAAFNRENARQDYLLNNGASIQKRALEGAGMSAAGLAGDFSPISSVPSQQGVSLPSMPSPSSIFGDWSSVGSNLAQQRLAESTADLQDANADKVSAEAAKLRKDLDIYDVKFSAEQSQREASAASTWADAQLKQIDIDYNRKVFDDRVKYAHYEAVNSLHRSAKTVQEIANLRATEKFTSEQTNTELHRQNLLKYQLSETAANTRKLIQDTFTSASLDQTYKDQHELQYVRKALGDLDVGLRQYEKAVKDADARAYLLPQQFEYDGKSYSLDGAQLKMLQMSQDFIHSVQTGNAALRSSENTVVGLLNSIIDTMQQGFKNPFKSRSSDK